jgi:hypothetical protein
VYILVFLSKKTKPCGELQVQEGQGGEKEFHQKRMLAVHD